jgi:DNA-binding NarL/FixJ family response regulator
MVRAKDIDREPPSLHVGSRGGLAVKKKVFIVDDHPVVRQGLAAFINGEDDFTVCGDAEDAETAIRRISSLEPDIIIADLSLKGTGGIELTSAIKARFNIPVLVLSMHDENFYAERAIRAGARGYIMKKESMEVVIKALRDILDGRVYVSNELKERLLGRLLASTDANQSPLDCLTNREMEVFQLIGGGLSNRHIAQKLSLSVKTVETYRSRIIEKLRLKDSGELVQYAVQWKQSNGTDR